jgi:signal transduction histidine kinase
VRQILLNLTSNAAKFTEKGSVTLSVKVFDDAEILFAVSDTGPGIDARERAAVFEPFTQTQSGNLERSGSGMGLPISKHLTEAHGGRIWFDTEPGEGTTFFVALPVKARQEIGQDV